MKTERTYWFKAKKSGLGWSTPLTWQGWAVYIAMFSTIVYFLVMVPDVGQRVPGVWVTVLIAVAFCWIFGEPLSGKKPIE